MRGGRSYSDYVKDMIEAVEKAQGFTRGMNREQFGADDKTVFAVVRALEIVGEAATKLPKDVLESHPSIPWREIRGIRNKLIHDYFGVDLDVVWKTVHEDLPVLRIALAQLLGEIGGS